ncbi:MAG TPA: hypothetical protein VMW45_04660 [Dehalococcoidia bacterium]|nr:hypothetical protein [Dehalococcoidia bacterium]
MRKLKPRGLGAISFKGKMIDIMSYRQARELVNFVGLNAKKEKRRQLSPAISLFQFFAASSARRM